MHENLEQDKNVNFINLSLYQISGVIFDNITLHGTKAAAMFGQKPPMSLYIELKMSTNS